VTLLLAATLFFCDPVLPDLPRAGATLEESDAGALRLVDRYDAFDLWTAQRVFGCWRDDDGRFFTLAVLDRALPALPDEPPKTRVAFEAEAVSLARDDERELARAVQALAPVPIAGPADWTKPRQTPRTCREVRYCEGTNEHCLVVAYLPEHSSRWQLAVWELAEEDDREACRELLEEKYLLRRTWEGKVPPEPARQARRTKRPEPSERDLLRRDLVHSITNHPAWRLTDSPGFVILDELGGRADFVARLTNELVAVRADYAKAVPSPIDGSNTLAVARLYAGREAYLLAAGPEMAWSAAYWCQARREIVAYLPEEGEESLVRTLRHEGFHQYLSYAGSMITAAPWINEGYAEYFERAGDASDEKRIAMLHSFAMAKPKKLTATLAKLLTMDYPEFYDEDPIACAFNYTLAWSIAYFLEKGAPEVRFRPFEKLTRDYMSALLKTQDRRRATESVFTDEMQDEFLAEWLKFYKDL